ncbi:LOW QUALITY PROTEIN: hypothetical protein SPRG_11920 [Saprolegnia parasitica CBS 223.65]|uniref:Uncharacterized protein n=1 Tax=Saprolegnia parasitica (strain CBS 223.65) TaxID=695850 RepID=A0A067BXS2_SAPPC|nr:LOW QUALITY PROTEIN: hypothetical protein SPRG_11920 [Saprolegnia parasitica CBS 223.65]KDO23073.1 LOW QUALITY PROTEIN: hypothetical protein SPRG_11920 [Saprolegnia parasitica CBS 223.65]|eukprot:XP_012206189.1 LOW QUALITY PROTEIN: hypothetical protein SPRG_11920 [Saprolegnia parasitica CBS 223.65]
MILWAHKTTTFVCPFADAIINAVIPSYPNHVSFPSVHVKKVYVIDKVDVCPVLG